LLAGIVEGFSGWRSTFIVSGIGPLLALAVIPLLPPVLADSHAAAPRLDFRPIFCNRPLMAYVVALAGNTREVFVVRVWFVAYLTWILGLPGNRVALPGPAVISGLASLVGFPVNTAVAKLALRYGRLAVIATCVLSVLVCVALAVTAGGPVRIVLPLLVLVQVTSIGDVGALTSGAVEAADAARRGAALAVYAFTGYGTAFAGPVVAGVALDWIDGAGRPEAWSAAFAAIAVGSAVAACAMAAARPPHDRA